MAALSVEAGTSTIFSTMEVTVTVLAVWELPSALLSRPALPTAKPPPNAATAMTQVTHARGLRAGGWWR